MGQALSPQNQNTVKKNIVKSDKGLLQGEIKLGQIRIDFIL